MRMSLRRSCAACAKAKHSCDLRTPRCSRCLKRNVNCVYVNEPLTSTVRRPDTTIRTVQEISYRSPILPLDEAVGNSPSSLSSFPHLPMTIGSSFNPFDSLPSTSLPRVRVQSLIHHFLSKIAFQYYPLDLNPDSNPFLVSWWPLALNDPALFNVSLQTASLDDEFHAQKGFSQSDALMKDCVSLIRQKIEDPSLAFQDATMNAVVTLAAIEEGKGNVYLSRMHIEGVKRMVKVRGGIAKIKESSPLTARMVPWVSMLVLGSPQFETQDDSGMGGGISAIPQWRQRFIPADSDPSLLCLNVLGLDPTLEHILVRLRVIFGQSENLQGDSMILSTTNLHDLTCFVLHRLLLVTPPVERNTQPALLSECVRYATSIYMFLIHGPTYFPHIAILQSLVKQLKHHLESLPSSAHFRDPLLVWLLSIGMVASLSTSENDWFLSQMSKISTALGLKSWEDTKSRLESVLWLESGCETLFRKTWENIDASTTDFRAIHDIRMVSPASLSGV